MFSCLLRRRSGRIDATVFVLKHCVTSARVATKESNSKRFRNRFKNEHQSFRLRRLSLTLKLLSQRNLTNNYSGRNICNSGAQEHRRRRNHLQIATGGKLMLTNLIATEAFKLSTVTIHVQWSCMKRFNPFCLGVVWCPFKALRAIFSIALVEALLILCFREILLTCLLVNTRFCP